MIGIHAVSVRYMAGVVYPSESQSGGWGVIEIETALVTLHVFY